MKTKEYYNGIASGYDELYGEEQLKKWEIARKIISFDKDDAVLDIGCGTGIITKEIAKLVKKVVAIDISKEMIKNAPKVKNIEYFVADATKLHFADKSFDKIISFTVLQDIKDKDSALIEMKRVCKGEILLTVQKRNKKIDEIKKLVSKYSRINELIEEEKDFVFLLV
jgi:ubiquinone/menaquinone biosynthesis C-methylase UbiE